MEYNTENIVDVHVHVCVHVHVFIFTSYYNNLFLFIGVI